MFLEGRAILLEPEYQSLQQFLTSVHSSPFVKKTSHSSQTFPISAGADWEKVLQLHSNHESCLYTWRLNRQPPTYLQTQRNCANQTIPLWQQLYTSRQFSSRSKVSFWTETAKTCVAAEENPPRCICHCCTNC